MSGELEVLSVTVSHAVAYHYRFRCWGWAIFTVNDQTGELHLQSDWGDFAHRWDPRASCLGAPNLKAFLAKANSHYIAGKLRVPVREFDERATVKEYRRQIVEARRERRIDRQEARDAFDELAGFDFDLANTDGFWTQYNDSPALSRVIGAEPYHDFQYRETAQYLRIRELIELFTADLRAGKFDLDAAGEVRP